MGIIAIRAHAKKGSNVFCIDNTVRFLDVPEGGVTGADMLDGKARLIAPETGEDVTRFHVAGACFTLEIAKLVGRGRAVVLPATARA